jgi:plasmid maintenance system antidote protein VapI
VGSVTTFDPDWCLRPGVTLREMMDCSGLTGDLGTKTIARLSGLDVDVIEGILSGKRRITKRIAAQLAAGTSPLLISAQFWLKLEDTYRAALKAGKTDVSDDG